MTQGTHIPTWNLELHGYERGYWNASVILHSHDWRLKQIIDRHIDRQTGTQTKNNQASKMALTGLLGGSIS